MKQLGLVCHILNSFISSIQKSFVSHFELLSLLMLKWLLNRPNPKGTNSPKFYCSADSTSVLIACDRLIAGRLTQVIISSLRGRYPTDLTEKTNDLPAFEVCQTTFGHAKQNHHRGKIGEFSNADISGTVSAGLQWYCSVSDMYVKSFDSDSISPWVWTPLLVIQVHI